MSTAELVADLVLAQHAELAVEVTLHHVGRLPEPVGVAAVDGERGWADVYVVNAFGADTLVRLGLEEIAMVDVTDVEWRADPSPSARGVETS